MPRADKVQAVAAIKDRIEGANAVFLAEYSGLSVKDQQTLRRSLRSGGAEFKVVKMTLARLAAEELEIDTLNDLLLGPTGLAFADDDAVVAAKALRDFAKEHDVFRIKGGLLGRDFLTPSASASWPRSSPRPVLLGRVAGAARAPMAKMANLLAALPRGLATAMQQLFERMEQDEPAAGRTLRSRGAERRAVRRRGPPQTKHHPRTRHSRPRVPGRMATLPTTLPMKAPRTKTPSPMLVTKTPSPMPVTMTR